MENLDLITKKKMMKIILLFLKVALNQEIYEEQ